MQKNNQSDDRGFASV